jgi:AmiR/NasT family two-component response regulator
LTDVSPLEDGRLRALIEHLNEENAQLERALQSRIVIEQAKGVLAERFGQTVDDAFELMRRAARSNRIRVHDLAQRVVTEPATPGEIAFERASA